MNKEARNVCDAILVLIHRIMIVDHEDRPDEIKLVFGDDELIITANISLEYNCIKKDEFDEAVQRIKRMMYDEEKKDELDEDVQRFKRMLMDDEKK